MGSERSNQLIGMALLRGLLDESRLREAMRSSGDPLEALIAEGSLDEEDLRDLGRLVDAQAQELTALPEPSDQATLEDAPMTGRGVWDSLPFVGGDGSDTGRQVLKVLTLPTWKQYRNLRFVAEGGMGRVFKAFDPSLNRIVALKFLRREGVEPQTRFLLEAQNQAMVEHPNICKVFEVGEWQGQCYIAMQFLRGETLEAALHRLGLADKMKVMEEVAEAVHAAHRRGLIHRDLKPANIMVEATDRGPKPTILDFGLAKGIEETGLTIQGQVIGTTHYMAPEQARGDHARVNRCTDIYGLGATLHKVLTGKAPFAEAGGMDAVRRTLEEDVPSLIRLVHDLPEDLDTITRKCLEKDPARRYESALAVAEDLRRWREGEPILARKPTLRYRAGKWARRHKLAVAVATVSLVGLILLGGVAIQARWSASSRARYAQFFGQEAERVEAFLRYIRLSPAHDIEAEMAGVEQRIRLLRDQVAKGGSLAQGPGHFALGRIALLLDQPQEARIHFEAARKAGYLDPEANLLEARARLGLFQTELLQVRQLPDIAARESRLRDLKQGMVREIRPFLEKPTDRGLEPSLYQRGLLALVEGRTEEARSLGAQIARTSPWFYEAQVLVSDAYAADALNTRELQGSLGHARLALEALEGCHAPSDTALLRRKARLIRILGSGKAAMGLDPHQALGSLEGLAKVWRGLEPNGWEPPHLEAIACLLRLEWNRTHGRAELSATQQLVDQAREQLGRLPGNPELQGLLGGALLEYSNTHREVRGSQHMATLEEALRSFLKLLEADPYRENLLTQISGCASSLLAYYREEGLPLGEWERLPARLESLAEQFPDLPSIQDPLAVIWVERAETVRLEGQDPRGQADKALTFARRLQALRPDELSGFRQEANAWIVKGWASLYDGADPDTDVRQALLATQQALKRNPRSVWDAVNVVLALRIQAEHLLRHQRDPRPLLRQAEEALVRVRGIDPRIWYRGFLAADLALLEAEWELGRGGDPERFLRRAMAELDRPWVQGNTAEAALLKSRVARLRWKAGDAPESEARAALANLSTRFPRMPETRQEMRLMGR